MFDGIQELNCDFLQYYVDLLTSYNSKDAVKEDHRNKLVAEVNDLAQRDDKYKFQLYKQFNPDLKPIDLHSLHFKFPRLRLSSHLMPVETGRWTRLKREERICATCNILGDEKHYIYTCPEIDRTNLQDIPELHELEKYPQLQLLMERLDGYL